MSAKAVEDGASERGRPSSSSKASVACVGDLSTRCEDTRTAALSLSMLNVGYSSSSVGGGGGRQGELEGVGRGVREEEERGTLAPETPQRAARPNPGEGAKSETKRERSEPLTVVIFGQQIENDLTYLVYGIFFFHTQCPAPFLCRSFTSLKDIVCFMQIVTLTLSQN